MVGGDPAAPLHDTDLKANCARVELTCLDWKQRSPKGGLLPPPLLGQGSEKREWERRGEWAERGRGKGDQEAGE